MVKALKKEIEELENEETKTFEEEVLEKKDEDEEIDKEEVFKEPTEESTEEEGEEAEEEPTEDETLKKQEAYKERQKKRQEDKAKRQEDLQEQATQATAEPKQLDDIEQIKATMAQYGQVVKAQQHEANIKQAGRELEALEKPFKEAFADYDDVVSEALELTKMRMVKQGIPETEADAHLAREKILIADRAAAQGKDPVEAVYKEAQDIVGVFDEYAVRKGYVLKDGKPKTNLQAMREISKPNAMSGGAGKGAAAAKKEWADLDHEEASEVSIGQLLRGEYK